MVSDRPEITLLADISDIKTSLGILIDATEANHALLTQILAACSGDGSGLLVEALNQLTHEIKSARERMDAVRPIVNNMTVVKPDV